MILFEIANLQHFFESIEGFFEKIIVPLHNKIKTTTMNRKLLISFILLLLGCQWAIVRGQFSLSSSMEHTLLTGPQYNIDAIAVFNTFPADAEITFTGTATSPNFQWSYNVGGIPFTSTQPTITAEPDVLYTIKINGTPTYYIYTIDYSQYIPTFNAIVPSDIQNDPCSDLNLDIQCTLPAIYYLDKNGNRTFLPRSYTISYVTASWSGESWIDSTATYIVTPSSAPINTTIDAPLQNTTISFTGDDIAEMMGMIQDTIYLDYTAIALKCHPSATIIERDAKNEKDRKAQNAIEGSAPLVVQFAANANPIEPVFYEWRISTIDDTLNYKRYNDAILNYTFHDSGDYLARLKVYTGNCVHTDTFNIKTMDSFLEVPNVFTPNNDGINDEFRVAFKSIKEFHIWIYNRWGRLVYSSDDPGKGWDGTINGRPASVGTYYYVINAYGYDYYTQGRYKGKPIRYKLSGDCNLLR